MAQLARASPRSENSAGCERVAGRAASSAATPGSADAQQSAKEVGTEARAMSSSRVTVSVPSDRADSETPVCIGENEKRSLAMTLIAKRESAASDDESRQARHQPCQGCEPK